MTEKILSREERKIYNIYIRLIRRLEILVTKIIREVKTVEEVKIIRRNKIKC